MTQKGKNHAKHSKGPDLSIIFVHAGAGYHSLANEHIHLRACTDAIKAGMAVLRTGGSAVDAVEMAVKVLEDREITNAGYGSNLTMDGIVECDASIVDHLGRSGGVGAVAQINNPISLARLVYEHSTRALSLRRVPPNFLVSQGATDFAYENGMSVLPFDALVSPAALDRWRKWRADLQYAEMKAAKQDKKKSKLSAFRPLDNESHRESAESLREEHTNAMVARQTFSHGSASNGQANRSSNLNTVSVSNSQKKTPDLAESVSSTPSPLEKYKSAHESSQNALINSSQKLPTFSTLNQKIEESSIIRDSSPDTEMSDIDDSMWEHPPVESQRWSDGSSEEDSTSSESSVHTLQLPSLTPSPPPPGNAVDIKMTDGSSAHPDTRVKQLHGALSDVIYSNDNDIEQNRDDHITDTVGVIAVDSFGHIACGSSSGGIGMKYRGRIGPAAIVGVGSAVIPVDNTDKQKTSVATVTSGTGEHMATTMAATVFAERLYQGVKRTGRSFEPVDDDMAVRSMIEQDFMGHTSVRNSHSAGAIGFLGIKKTRDGAYLYFAHNTDSFAIASMHSDEPEPVCTMSRNQGNGSIAQGGRPVRLRRKKQ